MKSYILDFSVSFVSKNKPNLSYVRLGSKCLIDILFSFYTFSTDFISFKYYILEKQLLLLIIAFILNYLPQLNVYYFFIQKTAVTEIFDVVYLMVQRQQ